jgi:hypothetical protein
LRVKFSALRRGGSFRKSKKLYAVIRFIIIRFEADLFAGQKRDPFPVRRLLAVSLKRVIMKREAYAGIRLALVFGRRQGIKGEVRRDGREGGSIRARRLPAFP